jgi:hypothetical protein
MDQIVPVTNAPNHTMTANLSVNGQQLNLLLTFNYNEMAQYWNMIIADQNNNVLLADIPLLTGVYPAANLLNQFQYLNIGSCYILDNSASDPRDYPDSLTLGTDFLLLWGDNV